MPTGALYGDDVVNITNGTDFHDNTAGLGGNSWAPSSSSVSEATFTSNLSDERAGAIGTDGFANADDSTFVDNLASGSSATGGAVYTGGAFSTTSSSYTGNTAVFDGAVCRTRARQRHDDGRSSQALGSGASGGEVCTRPSTVTPNSPSTVNGKPGVRRVPRRRQSRSRPAAGSAASLVILDGTTRSVAEHRLLRRRRRPGCTRGRDQAGESTVTGNTAQNDPNEGTEAGSSGAASLRRACIGAVLPVAANAAPTGAAIRGAVVAVVGVGVGVRVRWLGVDSGSTTSVGYSYDDDGSCGFPPPRTTASSGSDPMLGALADNGGPTRTMHPEAGSPLVSAIPSGSCTGCDRHRSAGRGPAWAAPTTSVR
ncbi:MAG: choice-of-anchor Q domain-containing protein [Acidimicrobiia bacterium]